jgi:ribosomal protein S18 acetylase RimI-like enzyme
MDDAAIREAVESDLPAILGVYSEAGIDSGDAFSVEEARAQLARFRQYPSCRVFVAELGVKIAGTYTLLILDKLGKRGTPAGVVEDVAVVPRYQGRGIGRAMMRHAMEECRAAGCYKLTLSSNLKREAAHRFYDGLGFERHGYSFRIELDR